MNETSLIINPKFNDHEISSSVELENIKIYTFLSSYNESSKKLYLKVIKEFFTRWKNLTLKQIESHHIELFINQYLEGLSNETKAIYKSALSSFFNYLIKDGYLAKNPVKALKRLKQNKTKFISNIPDHEEIIRMINVCKSERDKCIIELMYVTGLRANEFLNLKFSDFKIKDDWAYFSVVGKGSKTRRGKITKKLFLKIKELKPNKTDESHLFTQEKRRVGEPLKYTALYEIIKKASVNAGIKKNISPHSLRHAHATESLKNGAPLKTLQNTLGHSSATTTMLYLHSSNDEFSGEFLCQDFI